MMTVEEAITGRRSIRAFLPKPVPRELIERVLAIAGRAPSGSNVQPWRVWVLEGAARDEIVREAVARYDRGEASKREYNYYPVKWREPYLARRRACGWGLYGTLGIGRDDKDQHARPARPQLRLLRRARGPHLLDRPRPGEGLLARLRHVPQSIMVAARQFGLETCPQAAWLSFYDILQRRLGIPPDQTVVCGMALGYPDPDEKVNAFTPDRMPVAEFVTWVERLQD